jgi:tricorn protease
LFAGTAGRQTVLSLGATPRPAAARQVTVVPVESETALRTRHWVEDNRRKVDELSGGKLAYVWLPNTAENGYTYFNRYYFAQQDKKGAIIDERFNTGGSIADYMVDLMSRTLMGYFNNPVGERQPFTAPNAGIWGPKVMIIIDAAGSGGDMLPYMFRLKQIGPLVGTRTWGGLVGIWTSRSAVFLPTPGMATSLATSPSASACTRSAVGMPERMFSAIRGPTPDTPSKPPNSACS